MKLPDRLSQWSHLLALFPDEVGNALGDIARQLSPLIGTLQNERYDGEIEPIGFNGLTHKAHYERLLLSEWALQEKYPDEFMRRAVSNEHLFFELSREEPNNSKVSVALLDCGPDQLGRPRIVQLAIIILLARRAAKNNSLFYWGTLQEDGQKLYEGVNQENLYAWLKQRSFTPATTSMVEDKLKQLEETPNDLWLVTREDIPVVQTKSQYIKLSESLFEPDQIEVDIERKNSSKKQLILMLPEQQFLARILRNPFDIAEKAKATDTWEHTSSWLIVRSGKQVAFLNKSNQIDVFNIPDKAKKKSTKISKFKIPAGQRLIGINISKRSFSILCYDRESLYFHRFPGLGELSVRKRVQKVQSPENALQPFIFSTEKEFIYLKDDANNLRKTSIVDDKALFETEEPNVLSVGQLNNCNYCASYDDETNEVKFSWFLNGRNTNNTLRFNTHLLRKPKLFVYSRGNWHFNQIGCLAIEKDEHLWEVTTGRVSVDIEVLDGNIVVGVLNSLNSAIPKSADKSACLISLDKDKTGVWLHTPSTQKLCQKLPFAALEYQMNTRMPFLHYTDKSGDFITLDLRSGNELMRLEALG